MNQISRKLRSNSGATMIIALMFMMFCLFVGGSVLASASANGYRVAHLSDQQDYLDQRSAAMLISDELSAGSVSHQLTVHDVTQVVQQVTVGDGGVITPVGQPTTYHTITFQAPAGLQMNALQRVLYEATVWRYLAENSVDLTKTKVEITNFTYQGGTVIGGISGVTNPFWYQTSATTGQISITGSKSGTQFTAFTAYFESDDNQGLYDFLVSFGEFSQLKVAMHAFTGTRTPVVRETIAPWTSGGTTFDAQITTTSQQYVISWDTPMIEKGGA